MSADSGAPAAVRPGEPSQPPSGWASRPSVRRAAIAAWAVALVGYSLVDGLPTSRWQQLVWLLLAILALNLGRPVRYFVAVTLDWLPFMGILYLYDYTRGFADRLGTSIHTLPSVDVERWLFHGTIPSVWLQQHLLDPHHVRWYDVVVSLVYYSHFFVVWVIAGVLYIRSRPDWSRWARRLLILSYASLATFVLYPAAPPWYASHVGVIGQVQRIATRGWSGLGLTVTGLHLSSSQAGGNDFAAIPSLHAAFAALVAVYFWRRAGWLTRTVLAGYALVMAFALVYAGEHYVTDVLIGYVYVAATMVVAAWWERRQRPDRPALTWWGHIPGLRSLSEETTAPWREPASARGGSADGAQAEPLPTTAE